MPLRAYERLYTGMVKLASTHYYRLHVWLRFIDMASYIFHSKNT